MPVSFYPGPSEVYPRIPEYVQEAYQEGLLSSNHRSEAFMRLWAQTKQLLQQQLEVPEAYEVICVSSATECWQSLALSLAFSESLHLYSGDFGKKWAQYTQALRPEAVVRHLAFGLDEDPSPLLEAQLQTRPPDLLCLTYVETSNATQLPEQLWSVLRRNAPHTLVAVDATSAMGGVRLPWHLGDIWYASVQKCLGLPAGMGLLIVSPRAIQNAYQQGETRYYHSLIAQVENTRKQQTTHTPNVLGIYLLARTLADNPPIGTTHQRLQQQAQAYTACLETHPQLSLLVSNVAVRAPTVLAIKAAPEVLTQLYQKAATAGMTLGNGYGAWKHHTLRVANFPAIATEAHQGLIDLLNQYRF